MKVWSNPSVPYNERTPEEWRGTGVTLLGTGLIAGGLSGWLMWVLAPLFLDLDSDSAKLLGIFGGIVLLGVSEVCEGVWRLVYGKPSLWGTRALVVVLVAFIAGIAALAIIDGINPFALDD